MKISFKRIDTVTKSAFKRWWSKDPFRESAIIAYYAIFSLPGLLLVVIALAGYVFGRDLVNRHVADQITEVMGADTSAQIQNMITLAGQTQGSVWTTIIGISIILFGATGVFAQFQKSLNIIWEVKTNETKSGIWELVRVRLFSFGLIISIAFILMVSLFVSAMLTAFGAWVSSHFSEAFFVALHIFNSLFSFLILSMLFALMFKFLPDAKVKWRHVWIGSVVTGFLFEIGKFCLEFYFGKANPATGYGAASSVILILLWVSYASMIVFYGAEFTRAYAMVHDGDVPADKHAVKQKGRKA